MPKSTKVMDQMCTVESKKFVKKWTEDLRYTTPDTVDDFLADYWHEDGEFHAFHPINQLSGRKNIGDGFYKPYLTAFPNAKKHLHFLFSGESDGKDWVVTGGNLVGNFMEAWLGIPPTKLTTWVRFVEFCEVKNGKIVQSKMLFDLMSLLNQAGFKFFNALGPEIVIPGPIPNDGVMMGESDPSESMKSLKLEEALRLEGLPRLQRAQKTTIPDESTIRIMADYWQKDMMWYGPDGIGSIKSIRGYELIYELPWELTMHEIDSDSSFARFAEGDYVCRAGYPGISAVHGGDALFGLPASDKQVSIRSFDIYRREGDLLAENWCLMDMADLFNQLGVDVLKRVKENRFYQKV